MGWTYQIYGLVCTTHLNLVSMSIIIYVTSPTKKKKKEYRRGILVLFLCGTMPEAVSLSFSTGLFFFFCLESAITLNG